MLIGLGLPAHKIRSPLPAIIRIRVPTTVSSMFYNPFTRPLSNSNLPSFVVEELKGLANKVDLAISGGELVGKDLFTA